LEQIAKQLGLDSKELKITAGLAPYAAVRDNGKPWPSGTGSENEKRILYALSRSSVGFTFADLGTGWGAMATQLSGRDDMDVVYSIESQQRIAGKHMPGKLIPEGSNVELIKQDVVQWLKSKQKDSLHLIFEDSAHTTEITHAIYEDAKRVLVEGGIIISHDVCFPRWREHIQKGFELAGVEPELYLVDGDGCGLSIWQKPKRKLEVKNVEVENKYTWEIPTEATAIAGGATIETITIEPETDNLITETSEEPLPPFDPPKPKKRRKRKVKEVQPETEPVKE
jgi:hypothetical protein